MMAMTFFVLGQLSVVLAAAAGWGMGRLLVQWRRRRFIRQVHRAMKAAMMHAVQHQQANEEAR